MIRNHHVFDRVKWWSMDTSELDVSIIAEVQIPPNISSLPFVSAINLRKLLYPRPVKQFLKASLNNSGNLVVNQHFDWIPLLQIASNCEEQNIEVNLTQYTNAIILKTTKAIDSGEELKVWFSHELLALLQIPFLTPFNIINHQVYKCNRCYKTFNQPNPLKIHITYECNSIQNSVNHCVGNMINEVTQVTIYRKQNDMTDTNNNEHNQVSRRKHNLPTKEPKTHVCVFCGKLYTRKYGLKIHLRTHTGHKPLSCRFCGRPFSDPSNLNKHIRLHAQNRNGIPQFGICPPLIQSPSIYSNSSTPSAFRCELCGEVLPRKKDLERHVRSQHTN